MKHFFLSALLVAGAMASNAQGQLKLPSLSPTAKISQEFSTSSIDYTYSRPSMRGRKVFGDVVAFDHVWRTGANAPTKIKIGEDLEIGGMKVKAGEYAFYTIPGKDKWEIILNTGTGTWTANGYEKENDVARFSIKPMMMEGNCQTFTIQITDLTFNTCKLELMWERTKVVIPIVSHNGENLDVNIDKAINHPASLPYFQAANYYFESDRKLDLAKTYIDKAVAQDPKAFYMWMLKARIDKKLGNNEEAIAAAKKAMETANGNANEAEYLRNGRKIIDDINRSSRHKQAVD